MIIKQLYNKKMIKKVELRKKAKQIRHTLDLVQISAKIATSLRTVELYQNAQHIMIFYPLDGEINLLPLLRDREMGEEGSKNFYLPKIEGESIIVCPYAHGDELVKSKFKTKEPTSAPINPDILDLILVPALMVDNDFYRLGYGSGFYDKFLSKNALDAIKIVPIPSALIVDNLPHNEFDVQVDMIVDET